MISKWYEYKADAVRLRKSGLSIRNIEKKLGVPRSTLSGWLRDVVVSEQKLKILHRQHIAALSKARAHAAQWHRSEKERRVAESKKGAIEFVESLDTLNLSYLEIALAFLYMGEGSKKNIGLSMGNSNPKIIKFFLVGVRKLYGISKDQIRCDLHLRADQDPRVEVAFWADALGLTEDNFTRPVFDRRTLGRKTYDEYHGVCSVRCANVAFQRKLMYIASEFCEKYMRD